MTNTYFAGVSRVIFSCMKLFIRTTVGAAILALCSSQVAAYSSVCSNPKRARTLATAIVVLPDDNITKLEAAFEKLSTRVGMTTWSVGSSKEGRTLSQTLGLQSPKVSLSITARWKPGQHNALLKVERTCINDDLEPWAGYWGKVRNELDRAGYKLQ
jgi:hypothetical protein